MVTHRKGPVKEPGYGAAPTARAHGQPTASYSLQKLNTGTPPLATHIYVRAPNFIHNCEPFSHLKGQGQMARLCISRW